MAAEATAGGQAAAAAASEAGARRGQRAGAAQKREQENSGPKGDAHVFLGEQHKLQEVQQRGGFKPACVLYLGPFHTITLPD